jgi:hypothetical protein
MVGWSVEQGQPHKVRWFVLQKAPICSSAWLAAMVNRIMAFTQ